MNSMVEELKEKIDIVELISQYVQLKKRGSNYFGLCPFHSEKTPSFSVNARGQFFHCFGCGESGDAITFFMKIENIEFTDAIKELAERYNVNINMKKNEKNPILDIHEYAENYFYTRLKNNNRAMEYLEERKVDKKTIDSFRLGYAPAGNELYSTLRNHYKEDVLIQSGIFIKTSSGIYNRFSNRIIFPIKNEKSRTIAFGGRIINDDANRAKYINSPETAVFSKQKVLYGLCDAKDIIKQQKKIIITEGYMDCIRLNASGIKNAVATLGTALSTYHITTIKRYAENIFFNYDSDEAGFRAMARSARIILSSELFSYVISLTDKEDPDSFVLKYGKEAYLKKIEEAKDYFDYLIDYLKQKYDITKPQNKLKAVEEIKPILMSIKNTTMRSFYISKTAQIFNISENTLVQREIVREFFKNINKDEAFLSLLLKDIELISWVEDFENFGENLSSPYKELYYKIVGFYLTGETFKVNIFEKTLENDKLKQLTYSLLTLEHTEIDNRQERRKIFLSLISKFEIDNIEQKLKKLKKQLKENPTDELFEQYNRLFTKLKETIA